MTASYRKILSRRAKGLLISIVILFILVLASFIFLFLKSNFISVANNKIEKEVIFTSENADVWGKFPGKNNVDIINNLTFLHLKEPEKGEDLIIFNKRFKSPGITRSILNF